MHYTPSTIPAEAADALRPAFDRYGLHDAATWIERCRDGQAQLWAHGALWAITEVHDFASGRICHIVAMAGEFNHALLTEIEAWAKRNGCQKLHFTGRKGWERRLPEYQHIAIVMQKEIV